MKTFPTFKKKVTPPDEAQKYELIKNPDEGKPLVRLKPVKKSFSINSLKRLSPFLLMLPFIAGLFVYMLLTRNIIMHREWLFLAVIVFVTINLLLLDFCLWNYFEGKKKLLIWIIELPLSYVTITGLYQIAEFCFSSVD